MFIHNLKYTIKILFKNKVLIFWTFAFPIILGIFFNMAFSSIEKDEKLNCFNIAVINNENFKNQEIYQETLKELSNEKNENKLFNIKYVNQREADELLDNSEIEGYLLFENDSPKIIVKKSGNYQTILKFVVDEIEQDKIIIDNLAKKEIEQEISKGNMTFEAEKVVNDILNKIDSQDTILKDKSSTNLSYMMIEYYTLIAMACMYSGMLGLYAVNGSLANMSNKGKRIAVSPTRKSIIVLSSIIGSYLVSIIGIALLLLFLLFILKADFGNNLILVIILSLIGDLAGISLGVLIASAFKVSEGAKTGITIAITMFLSVLSGMMGVTLKYVIDTNIPIINKLNPNNLITDGFYSLYYYNTLERFYNDILLLSSFIVICFVISFISLRREKYDSI